MFFGLTGLLLRQSLALARIRSFCSEAVSGMRVAGPRLTGGATSPGMGRGSLSLSGRVPARAGFRVCGTERPA